MDGSDMNWASLWHRQANKYEIFVFVFFFSKYLFGLMSVRLWTLHLNLRREQGKAFVDSKLVVQRCLDSFQYEALFVMSSREMIANSIHSRLVRDYHWTKLESYPFIVKLNLSVRSEKPEEYWRHWMPLSMIKYNSLHGDYEFYLSMKRCVRLTESHFHGNILFVFQFPRTHERKWLLVFEIEPNDLRAHIFPQKFIIPYTHGLMISWPTENAFLMDFDIYLVMSVDK